MSVVTLLGYIDTVNKASEDGAMGATWVIVSIAIWLLSIVAFWRVFEKAKKPGIASIIPIYNVYVVLKIVGRPGWWLFLYLVPIVNVFVHLVVALDTAKAFKKSTAFGIFGLWIFSLIGYMILGFGDAKYKGVPKH